MVSDNWRRDIDKHERVTEYSAESIVCELPVDSIEDVHRSVKSHHPSRTRDVPFYVDAQFSCYKEGTNQSPKEVSKLISEEIM